jgi:hypothetical protein
VGFSGDGGPATSAGLHHPTGLAVDGRGNIIFTDRFNHRIRFVNASTGMIHTTAGSAVPGFDGDGGPASSASLFYPFGLAVDSGGSVFIAGTFSCWTATGEF